MPVRPGARKKGHLLLLDIPENSHWGDDHPREPRVIGRGQHTLPERVIPPVAYTWRWMASPSCFCLAASVLRPTARVALSPLDRSTNQTGLVAVGRDKEVGHGRDQVRTGGPGVQEVPAALVDGVLLGPAREHGAPVHGLHFHVHARLAQQVGCHQRRVVGNELVGGVQQHDIVLAGAMSAWSSRG